MARPGLARRDVDVLHLASGDLWAGAETMLWYLVREQVSSSSVHPRVVLLNEGQLARRLREIGVEVTVLPEDEYSVPRLLIELSRLMKRIRPDVIHTHRNKENVLGGIAAWSASIPSIRTVHGAQEHPAKWWNLVKRVQERADSAVANHLQKRTVAVSEALGNTLRAVGIKRVHIIHNGIDAAFVRELAERASTTKPDNRLVLGFVGRLTPVKRVDKFLDIARRLHDRNPVAFRFWIIGDGPLRQTVQEMFSSSGLDGSVTLYGHVEDAYPLLKALDALIITSDNEGIPYTVLECLSLGIPVIASRVGGLPEVLQRGRAGVLVETEDIEGFVSQGTRLSENSSVFERNINYGKHLVRGEFSARAMMQQYTNVYCEVCRRR